MTAALTGLELTNEQRRIVEWGDGPAVVIAGAGTGKTRVIVERVRHLLEAREGLQPENLLVLTYNVKAARRAARAASRRPSASRTAARMTVSNFHSFCQRDPDRERRLMPVCRPPRRARRGRPGAAAARPRARARAALSRDQRLLATRTSSTSSIDARTSSSDRSTSKPSSLGERRVVRGAIRRRYEVAVERLETQGNLTPLRGVRGAYARQRASRASG